MPPDKLSLKGKNLDRNMICFGYHKILIAQYVTRFNLIYNENKKNYVSNDHHTVIYDFILSFPTVTFPKLIRDDRNKL